ncbi:glycosyltransferase family 2 protein [Sphingobacterium sp. SG20118]|uniref:glycosyltransferase family 2 protein n=1 Tax=Sphingobacterium sp. SG20118 TaxID=3367156 RepID=UPI0037DFC54D
MENQNIKLSIITINLNNKEGLKKTLKSIDNQSNKNFEYLVIDGDSTDGSIDLINDATFINIKVSENDSGIYDAMNKGIRIANGEYLLFLNSGDYLNNSEVINNILPQLQGEEIIYGSLIYEGKDSSKVQHYPRELTLRQFINDTIGHPCSFIKKELFTKYGFYDTSYPIVADWAFFTKVIVKENVSTKHINEIITNFDLTGITARPENYNKINAERERFLKENFSFILDDFNKTIEAVNKLKKIQSSKGFKILKALGVKKFQ